MNAYLRMCNGWSLTRPRDGLDSRSSSDYGGRCVTVQNMQYSQNDPIIKVHALTIDQTCDISLIELIGKRIHDLVAVAVVL